MLRREPFLKGVSLHNPTLLRARLNHIHPSAPERGCRVSGSKVYGEVLGPLRDGSNDRTGGDSKGNRKAVGPERRMWCRVKWDSQSQPGTRETHSRR
jgi:hypothetical protein